MSEVLKNERIYRVNDFFCGAGGMGLGFKESGFRLGGAWDFDKHAVLSYGTNISPKVKQMDVREMSADDVPITDVWTFGFPCQDLSYAGYKAGMVKGKTRSGLFYEIMRLLNDAEQKPKIILAENVKGVRSVLPEIEKEYNENGYTMFTRLYNSKYWQAQNRERYFIIGVHESINKDFVFPMEPVNRMRTLRSALENEVEEKYFMSDEKSKNVIEEAMKQHRENKNPSPSQGEPAIIVVGRLDMKGHESIRRVYSIDGISPTLTTSEGGHRQPKVLVPVLASDGSIETYRVRKLSPREYATLQGFPQSYTFTASNTQLYKQFGNAVTVDVSRAIAGAIKDFLDESY